MHLPLSRFAFCFLLGTASSPAASEATKPRDVSAPFVLAGNAFADALHAGDLDGAMLAADDMVKVAPQSAIGYYARATVWQRRGKPDRAMEALNESILHSPTIPDPFIDRSALRTDLGQFELVIQDADAALRIASGSAVALNNRGYARFRLGQADPALEDFNKALQIKPAFPRALTNRGNLYLSLGKIAEALADQTEAIRQKPDYEPAYRNRAEARWRTGDFAGALGDVDEALHLAPQDGKAYAVRATIYSAQDKSDEARADFETAIRLDPGNPNAFAGLAYLLATRTDSASRDLKRAIELAFHARELEAAPTPYCVETLAVVLAQAGQLGGAVDVLSKAIPEIEKTSAPSQAVEGLKKRLDHYQELVKSAVPLEKSDKP